MTDWWKNRQIKIKRRMSIIYLSIIFSSFKLK